MLCVRAALLCVLLLACDTTPPVPPGPIGLAVITEDALRADVTFLADDAFRGRETGTPDAERAAAWIAERMTSFGLQPLPGDTDLYADYTLYERSFDREGTALALTVDGQDVPATLGESYRPFDFSDPGRIEGQVVFAGYGITAPEHDWDDYAGLDVTGKIVLILRHEPGENDADSPFDGAASSEHASFTRKAQNAAEHGAIGYLLVTDPLHHEASDDLRVGGRMLLDKPEPGQDPVSEPPLFRAAQIDRATAEALIVGTGKDLATLQRELDAGTLPSTVDLGAVQARLSVALQAEAQPVPERNVVAMLPGRDKPDEWVVIGAHYDHIGAFSGDGDTVFNGADDNASGTSGLLALAKAFASRPTPPARSLVFMAYSGEEKGLLGSKAWVRDHGVDNVVFMLNLDMIGRNPDSPITVYGDGYGSGMTDVVTAAAAAGDLGDYTLTGSDYFGASDHDSFYRQAVPFLFFFTGTHDDYHQLGDHSDKLAYDRMVRILRTAFHVLEPVADAQVTPAFIHHPGWLGASLEGDRISSVEADGRAAQAGLKVGDVLTVPNDTDGSAQSAGAWLSDVAPGTELVLDVTRDGQALQVSLTRTKVGYMGIFPAAPSEEQATALGLLNDVGVLVRGVPAGGPAAKGGLKEGDIIVLIAGESVQIRTLGRVLQRVGAGETVRMRIVRDGEPMDLEVTLGERPGR